MEGGSRVVDRESIVKLSAACCLVPVDVEHTEFSASVDISIIRNDFIVIYLFTFLPFYL